MRKIPRSERGSIADIRHTQLNPEEATEKEMPATPFEKRMEKLYDMAIVSHNEAALERIGFIVMPNSGNREMYPITLFRHREYVQSLGKKFANKIEETKAELDEYFTSLTPAEKNDIPEIAQAAARQKSARQAILFPEEFVKIAGKASKSAPRRSFRRVIE